MPWHGCHFAEAGISDSWPALDVDGELRELETSQPDCREGRDDLKAFAGDPMNDRQPWSHPDGKAF